MFNTNKNKLFQITYNSDDIEGRGREMLLNIYFEEEAEAMKFITSKYYSEKYGVMGSQGSKYDIKTVATQSLVPNIYKNINDFENKTDIVINMTEKEKKINNIKNMSREELIEMAISKI